MHTLKLDSGELKFRVTQTNGVVAEWKADLVVLRLAAEQLERQYNLVTIDGQLYATPEFLEALAARYVERGCPECDPTQARGIWIAVNQRFNVVDAALTEQLTTLQLK